MRFWLLVSCRIGVALLLTGWPEAPTRADEADATVFGWQAQATAVDQYHPPFTSPDRGPHSLDPGHRGNETFDATLFAGWRLAPWLAAYADPEIDQGFGLSDTLGVAGFPSAEAYKLGAIRPYLRLQRAFLRATIGLDGAAEPVAAAPNQLAGTRQAGRVVVTLGKFAVTDIFDTNDYAHDPKNDFLNWSVIDAGTFDYAADPWGYTYGAAAEWSRGWWTLRGGVFDLSRAPNGRALQRGFGQNEIVGEAEARGTPLFAEPGVVKLTAFVNHGSMGDYTAAIRTGRAAGTVPDIGSVRHMAARPGLSLDLQQQLAPGLGAFLRAGANDGHKETYEFTEIDRTVSLGLALAGVAWDRPDDTIGLAGVVNGLSRDARAYFAAGGLGILIGDGRLPDYADERILESNYRMSVADRLDVTLDCQLIAAPAYNAERGPVTVIAARLHVEI